ncbi:hypothetical protein ABZS83_00105 [Streptomyces sp. NPDC005426]|uniref:hypothetical protein n=1 Tax=Streptomyces sp. NPDC005426 TaxID=3155344 RepID=UPI0033A04915
MAVGLRVALHPQIDLATEPRCSRITGPFGEDADLTSKLMAAYISGLHGPTAPWVPTAWPPSAGRVVGPTQNH